MCQGGLTSQTEQDGNEICIKFHSSTSDSEKGHTHLSEDISDQNTSSLFSNYIWVMITGHTLRRRIIMAVLGVTDRMVEMVVQVR